MSPKDTARLLRVLSTPLRVAILRLLIDEPNAVTTSLIAARLNEPDGSVSYNLMKLADTGLLIRAADGRNRFYTPNRLMLNELAQYFIPHKGPTPL